MGGNYSALTLGADSGGLDVAAAGGGVPVGGGEDGGDGGAAAGGVAEGVGAVRLPLRRCEEDGALSNDGPPVADAPSHPLRLCGILRRSSLRRRRRRRLRRYTRHPAR